MLITTARTNLLFLRLTDFGRTCKLQFIIYTGETKKWVPFLSFCNFLFRLYEKEGANKGKSHFATLKWKRGAEVAQCKVTAA